MLCSHCFLQVPRDILWQGYPQVVATGGLGRDFLDSVDQFQLRMELKI